MVKEVKQGSADSSPLGMVGTVFFGTKAGSCHGGMLLLKEAAGKGFLYPQACCQWPPFHYLLSDFQCLLLCSVDIWRLAYA